MAEEPGRRASDELLDKYFDTFKHLSTLNIATGVLAVAFLTRRYDDLGGITLAIWCFAASVVLALGGMEAVLTELRSDPPRPVPHRLLRRLHYASVALLGAGLGLSLWQAV